MTTDTERLDFLERKVAQFFSHYSNEYDYGMFRRGKTIRDQIDSDMATRPRNPYGCKRPIVDSWWKFCGETDMGQTAGVLCVECGGNYVLKGSAP